MRTYWVRELVGVLLGLVFKELEGIDTGQPESSKDAHTLLKNDCHSSHQSFKLMSINWVIHIRWTNLDRVEEKLDCAEARTRNWEVAPSDWPWSLIFEIRWLYYRILVNIYREYAILLLYTISKLHICKHFNIQNLICYRILYISIVLLITVISYTTRLIYEYNCKWLIWL